MRCIIIAVLSVLITHIRCEEDESLLKQEDLILKYINQNSTITPRKIRFEDDQLLDENYSSFDEQSGQPLRFEDSPGLGARPGRVTFQDDNRVEEPDPYAISSGNREPTHVTFQDDNKIADPGIKKKRRRRRRKPRYQLPPGQYNPGQPIPLGPEYPGFPGQPFPGNQGIGPGGRPIGPYNRPPRRPKQSFASEALSKVAGALSSIALYDDYQCVPRLLCEAAGGGALGSSPVLQSIAGLQPLLTLLSAYNGISTSPLFVFGRAVFLGMTSKGNTASCRYAYSQCPTDPEQLVHYLNNHNGGFFRFFNSPQPQIPQNVEQFYNQLGQYGFQQNNGLYDPSNQIPQNQFGPQPSPGPQNYGIPNPQLDPQNPGQYGFYNPLPQNYGFQQNVQSPYGFYQQTPYPQPQYQSTQGNQQYGLNNNPYLGPPNPNFYANQFNYANPYNYGPKYPYGSKYGVKNIRFKDNSDKGTKIEKRIQNKPSYLYIDSNIGNVDVHPKWIFPENSVIIDNTNANNLDNNVRGGKALKFPEESVTLIDESVDSNRKGKSILFPESQTTKYVNYYAYPPVDNNDNFKFGYQNYDTANSAVAYYNYNKDNNYNVNAVNNNNRYVNSNSNLYNTNNGYGHSNYYSKYMFNSEEEDGVQTVYVVRGNGDPNHPEIIKVRPGEKVIV